MTELIEPTVHRAPSATDHVLVVDDDDSMRETVVEILAATGIEADGAASAAAAQSLHERLRPGVVLVDQRLPDSSGVELGAQLKRQDEDVTVLLVTGYASLENAIAAVWQLDGYLTKPVPPAELVRVVRAGLEHARLRRENRALVEELRRTNLKLEASVADRTGELTGLLRLAEALAGSGELEAVLQAGLDTASAVTGARAAGLYVADAESGDIPLRAATEHARLPRRLDLVAHDPAVTDVVSLTAGGQNVGSLVLEGATRRHPMFLATLAASAAVAIQNAQRFERERQTVAQLSEVSRLKSTFLAAVSHELRTPLAVVLGLAELLVRRSDTMPAERRAQMAEQILGQAQHLSALIDDLLDASRIEFGGLRVSLGAVDVARTATDVARAFETSGRSLVLDVPADLPPAVGDEARLVQVLNNLAGNAFKHSPAGTPVELRARADGDRVSIAVIDSGPGIEPEFLAHIFEPFSQASGSGGREDGLGLGLYIVQALAEAMGGAVRAESSPGTGSRFTVTLRRA